ncbi:hypothetical protein Tco_1380135 [Tanacetum coccineum]
MKHRTSSTNLHSTNTRPTRVNFVEGTLIRVLIVKQGTHPSLIKVLVTIKNLDLTNLYIILRVSPRHILVSYVGTMLIMVMIVRLKFCLSLIRTRVTIKTLIIFHKLQFPLIHHPPQATDTEMLQARENLWNIQPFLKEYDHIPPKEKCMALLLAGERFLKIKQAMEEEQNQPKVMQELLLKLMKDLQILKGIQPKQAEQEEPVAQNFLLNLNFPMVDDDEYT